MSNIKPKYDSNNFLCSKCQSITIHNSLNLFFYGNHKEEYNYYTALECNKLGYFLGINVNLSDNDTTLEIPKEIMNGNTWKKIYVHDPILNDNDEICIYIRICSKCGNRIYFDKDSKNCSIELANQNMINCDVEFPNKFLDSGLAKIYNEARNIYKISPRAAAALMRYVLEQILKTNFPKINNYPNLSEMLNSDVVKNKIGSNLVNVGNNIRIIANKLIHTNEIDMEQVDINMPEVFKWINDIANVIYNDYSVESDNSNDIKNKIIK